MLVYKTDTNCLFFLHLVCQSFTLLVYIVVYIDYFSCGVLYALGRRDFGMDIKMIKNIALVVALATISFSSQASTIQYAGYSRADNSNVVQGFGLQWLSWQATQNQSIDTALTNNAGWRLASNQEMATLFNHFGFGGITWTVSEDEMLLNDGWTLTEDSRYDYFLQLFGVTETGNNGPCLQSCFYQTDPDLSTAALFGSDANQNGKYNAAAIFSDATYKHPTQGDVRWDQEARWYADAFDRSMAESGRGVALVRDTVAPTQPINAPTTLGLMAIAWLALRFGYQR